MTTPEVFPGVTLNCSYDDRGYGPQGKHSRIAWRDECLANLRAGKDQFKAWQECWKDRINHSLEKVTFAVTITNSDGTSRVYLGYTGQEQKPYSLDFMMVDFDNKCNLHSYDFTSAVLFCGSTFPDKAVFDNVTFHADAHFEEAYLTSRKEASFRNTTFKGIADFSVQNFNHEVDFSGATFEKDAIFLSSEFNWVNFKNATFKEVADFNENIFNGDCKFVGAEFQNEANFFKSEFKRQSRFNFDPIENKKYGNQDRETKFFSVANFENAKFENIGHFERVRFISMIPNFRGCKIGDTHLEFSDDSYFPKNESSEDAIKNISFLKRLSDEHGQTDQALNFNAMELKAKRRQKEPQAAHWSFKLMTWLYEKLSNYGRSFVRPLLGYGALIVCSLLLTLPLTDYSQDTTPETVANRAICQPKDKEEAAKLLHLTHGQARFEYALFRAGGVMDFTDTGKQNNAVNCRLFGVPIEPPLMRAWGIFKGIASLALLFLAALGLRNKYRIK